MKTTIFNNISKIIKKWHINIPNKTNVDDKAAAFNEWVISQMETKVNGTNELPKIEQN